MNTAHYPVKVRMRAGASRPGFLSDSITDYTCPNGHQCSANYRKRYCDQCCTALAWSIETFAASIGNRPPIKMGMKQMWECAR